MAQEHEIIARMKDDLKRGAELCRRLQKNAVEMAPREMTYMELKRLCRRLEDSCRQITHERGDDERRTGFTWLELSNHFKKLSDAIQSRVRECKWLEFGKLAEVFDLNLKRIPELAEKRSEQSSLSGQLLILPRHLRGDVPKNSGLILP